MKDKIKAFFHRPIWTDYRFLFFVWFVLSLVSAVTRLQKGNNFKVFRGMFWHTIDQLPLYVEYPNEYFDIAHYGPAFSIIVAPFAACPFWLGLILWNMALAVGLWWAIRHLPMAKKEHIFLFWICANELFTALVMQQFNIATVALICGTFICIEQKRDFWAALLIVIGTFVKIYGIVGFAFFFFSRKKITLILSTLFWSAVLFVLPRLISSPEYIIQQYSAWAVDIAEKNGANTFSLYQNISLLGIVRKVSGITSYSDLWLIVPGIILFGLPYLRIKQFANLDYRFAVLASVLMFVVLFSSGSESSGYIIAFVGVAIWYCKVPWQRSKFDLGLLIFAFIITSLSPSDLFPQYLRDVVIRPYSLKALPVAIIWFKLIYEMLTRDYAQQKSLTNDDYTK